MTDILHQDIAEDAFTSSEKINNKTNDVKYSIVEATLKNVAYADLTGHFPYRSNRGNECILVGYNYNDNTILAEPLKNRIVVTITEVWEKTNNKFATVGIQPRK